MKTKSYKATFFRHNPQFKNGGYVTERKIEAVSLPSARKRAREISEHCVYGSMELLDIEMEDEHRPVRVTAPCRLKQRVGRAACQEQRGCLTGPIH